MTSKDNKIVEIFIPGPAGRLEAKYYKSNKNTSPICLVLHPHPQYGGTMNNKVVVDAFLESMYPPFFPLILFTMLFFFNFKNNCSK